LFLSLLFLLPLPLLRRGIPCSGGGKHATQDEAEDGAPSRRETKRADQAIEVFSVHGQSLRLIEWPWYVSNAIVPATLNVTWGTPVPSIRQPRITTR
jgi:hypothetical protein